MTVFNPMFAVRAGLMLLAVAALACSSDPTRVEDHDHGDEVDAVRVSITRPSGASDVYELERATIPHEIALEVGENPITVQWLDHDGDVITDLGSDFALEIEDLPAEMTYTSVEQFSGIIAVTEAPAVPVTSMIELFHISGGHGDFSVAVSFTVAP